MDPKEDTKTRTRRRYSTTFINQIIDEYFKVDNASELVRKYKIPRASLYRWLSKRRKQEKSRLKFTKRNIGKKEL